MKKRPPIEQLGAKFVYDRSAPGIIVTPPDPNQPTPSCLFPEHEPEQTGVGIPRQPVLSIGSSLHPWSDFERLLRTASIEVLVDVRSSPRSRLPHFNQASLREGLRAAGIRYLFQGDALGGRPSVGLPDYEIMATLPSFVAAVEQVIGIASRHRTVLMCSEHEPLTCHRCLLIGRAMTRRGVSFRNILRDGSVETQSETEDRLLKATRQTEADIQASRETRLAAAYRLQNQRLNRHGAWRGQPSGRRGSGPGSR